MTVGDLTHLYNKYPSTKNVPIAIAIKIIFVDDSCFTLNTVQRK